MLSISSDPNTTLSLSVLSAPEKRSKKQSGFFTSDKLQRQNSSQDFFPALPLWFSLSGHHNKNPRAGAKLIPFLISDVEDILLIADNPR